MRVTIKDIANQLNLSTTTVSQVLNGKGQRFSAESREKIFKLAEELNYQPNRMARALSTQKTQTVGVVVPDVSNPFFAALVKHIDDLCHQAGLQILLCNSNDRPEDDLKMIDMLLNYGVDGLLLSLASASDNISIKQKLQSIAADKKPMVLIDRIITDVPCSSVSVDYYWGAYIAVEYLLKKGHEKIGIITGPAYMSTSEQRLQGALQALKDHHVSIPSDLIQEGTFHYTDGIRLSGTLIDKGVTAIFASNDLMAYGVYNYAREHDIKIPDDLSLVGFDNLFFSRILNKPLTTVNQPIEEIATKATQLLFDQISEPESPVQNIVLKPSLAIRESVRGIQ